MIAKGRPGVPRGAEEAAGDAVARGGEKPFDAVEGAGERGGGRVGGGGFLFLRGGEFGSADDGRAEGENFLGEARVDRTGSEGVDVEREVAGFVGDGFDEADDAGFGDAVGGEIGAGFGGAAAGEADNFFARRGRRGRREEWGEGADGEVGAVEISADGGAPAGGVGGEGGGDLALETGGADEGVEVRPGGGERGHDSGDGGVVGDVAAGVVEVWMRRGEVGLVAAGEAPDVVATGEETLGEGASDAGAGAGEDKVHQ